MFDLQSIIEPIGIEKRKKIVNLYYEKQKNDLNKKIESLNNPRIPSYFNEN